MTEFDCDVIIAHFPTSPAFLIAQAHFEDNPRDLEVLRHDKTLQHAKRIQPHLKHIPSYLLPKGLEGSGASASLPAAPERKRGRGAHPAAFKRKRKDDPLKTFSFSQRGSKTA